MADDMSGGLGGNATSAGQSSARKTSSLPPQPRICEPGGSGLFLPLGGEAEINWDPKFRVMIYGVGLVYCFLGVSIVADMFMAAIEKITSKQKKTWVKGTKRFVTVQVWNETVANLTLMALGSSAPEILLALNDVLKNRFFEGKLGPSTIVGSAAFNLFVIIAVCINSIPDGEVRVIKEWGVFVVTAIFSTFAYIWVLYIVQFNSRDVVELWEGCLTFAFFPALVVLSYGTDSGWFTRDSIYALLVWVLNPSSPRYLADEEDEEEEPDWSPGLCFAGWCGLLCRIAKSCCRRGRSRSHTATARELEEEEDQEDFQPEDPILDDKGVPIDFEAGIMTFASETLVVDGTEEECEHKVMVYRKNGTRGRVRVKYSMTRLTAVPGYDYEEDEGELLFRDGMTQLEITMKILPKAVWEKDDQFQLIIEDESGELMFNPFHDGGEEKNILTVHIINATQRARATWRSKIWACLDRWFNMDELALGNVTFREQIMEAYYVNGSREEQDNASLSDWVVHVIWMPWKISLSCFCPPPVYLGGWLCFFFSLLGIGLLTMIIGDLAELFGCAMDIDDSITAITVVAMGTSVPDLFASRAAAKQDEYADASIVNVTGSNSVNVFLGIGLPWMLSAFYWRIRGPNAEWTDKYSADFGSTWGANGQAVFVVQSGQLFFSVMVFTIAGIICLTVIEVRRYVFGGELGGQPDPKAYSSFLLISLWFFYLTLSIWKLVTKTEDVTMMIAAVCIGLCVICVMMVLFAICLQMLKVSKEYIGEEGFWGIFVAAGIIGGRLVFFAVFQMQT